MNKRTTLLILAMLTLLWSSYAFAQKTDSGEEPRIVKLFEFAEGLAVTYTSGGTLGFINTVGKIVLTLAVHEAKGFSDNLSAVRLEKKWGYIDHKGKYVIIPQFEEAMDFTEGMAAVRKGNGWGVINKKGDMTIGYVYEGLKRFNGGIAPAKQNGKWGFIASNGKFKIKPAYLDAGEFSEKLAPVKTAAADNAWGYINPSGKFAIETQFDEARAFNGGLAPVMIDTEWGYINKKGKIAINPQYNDALPFSEGLAAVRDKNNQWGYIDKKGKYIIKPAFSTAGSFSGGLAKVTTGDRITFIKKNGKESGILSVPVSAEKQRAPAMGGSDASSGAGVSNMTPSASTKSFFLDYGTVSPGKVAATGNTIGMNIFFSIQYTGKKPYPSINNSFYMPVGYLFVKKSEADDKNNNDPQAFQGSTDKFLLGNYALDQNGYLYTTIQISVTIPQAIAYRFQQQIDRDSDYYIIPLFDPANTVDEDINDTTIRRCADTVRACYGTKFNSFNYVTVSLAGKGMTVETQLDKASGAMTVTSSQWTDIDKAINIKGSVDLEPLVDNIPTLNLKFGGNNSLPFPYRISNDMVAPNGEQQTMHVQNMVQHYSDACCGEGLAKECGKTIAPDEKCTTPAGFGVDLVTINGVSLAVKPGDYKSLPFYSYDAPFKFIINRALYNFINQHVTFNQPSKFIIRFVVNGYNGENQVTTDFPLTITISKPITQSAELTQTWGNKRLNVTFSNENTTNVDGKKATTKITSRLKALGSEIHLFETESDTRTDSENPDTNHSEGSAGTGGHIDILFTKDGAEIDFTKKWPYAILPFTLFQQDAMVGFVPVALKLVVAFAPSFNFVAKVKASKDNNFYPDILLELGPDALVKGELHAELGPDAGKHTAVTLGAYGSVNLIDTSLNMGFVLKPHPKDGKANYSGSFDAFGKVVGLSGEAGVELQISLFNKKWNPRFVLFHWPGLCIYGDKSTPACEENDIRKLCLFGGCPSDPTKGDAQVFAKDTGTQALPVIPETEASATVVEEIKFGQMEAIYADKRLEDVIFDYTKIDGKNTPKPSDFDKVTRYINLKPAEAIKIPAILLQSGLSDVAKRTLIAVLAQSGTPQAQEALTGILENPNQNHTFRLNAAIVLGYISKRPTADSFNSLVRMYQNKQMETGDEDYVILSNSSMLSIGKMIRLAGNSGTESEKALKDKMKYFVEQELNTIHAKSNRNKTGALLGAVQNSRDAFFVPAVKKLLDNEDPNIREKAAASFKYMTDNESAQLLKINLQQESDGLVKSTMIKSMIQRDYDKEVHSYIKKNIPTEQSNFARKEMVNYIIEKRKNIPTYKEELKEILKAETFDGNTRLINRALYTDFYK